MTSLAPDVIEAIPRGAVGNELSPRRNGRRTVLTEGGAVRKLWNKERVITALLKRLREHKLIHSTALAREDPSLHRAIRRHLRNWHLAMVAAGLDPALYRRCPAPTFWNDAETRERIARQAQADDDATTS